MHYLLLFKKFYCWPFSNITPLMQENPNKCFDVISKALVLTYFHLTKGHVTKPRNNCCEFLVFCGVTLQSGTQL